MEDILGHVTDICIGLHILSDSSCQGIASTYAVSEHRFE